MVPKKGSLDLPLKVERYIESNFVAYPVGIGNYQSGFTYEHLCCLCDEPHDEAFEHEFPNGMVMPLCDKCGFEVDLAEMYKGGTGKDAKALERLDVYLSTGNFPYDFVEYATQAPQLCIFCDEHLDPHERNKVEIPVGAKCFHPRDYLDAPKEIIPSNLNYYEASVCDECYDYANESLENTDILTDKCYPCGNKYPVTKQVYQERMANITLGKHVCSSCWLSRGFSPSSPRIVTQRCKSCRQHFTIDFSYAKAMYFRNSPNICPTCSKEDIDRQQSILSGGKPNIQDSYTIEDLSMSAEKSKFIKMVEGNVYLMIVKQDKGWMYQILEFDQDPSYKGEIDMEKLEWFKELHRDLKQYSIEDATSLAYAKAYEILQIRENNNYKLL